jgi:2-polyprenyl-3-methyl-5-hydroxy-6-metoxy-1,4-benzoquinol methylase
VLPTASAASAALLLAFCAGAAAQAVHGIEPVVGQPGKDVVWVPSPHSTVEKMLFMAAVTPRDTVVDLGSGDGRIVIAAAKMGAKALGIEYNPDLVEYARAPRRAKAFPAARASCRRTSSSPTSRQQPW